MPLISGVKADYRVRAGTTGRRKKREEEAALGTWNVGWGGNSPSGAKAGSGWDRFTAQGEPGTVSGAKAMM